jgi:hypothetical protein
LRRDQPFQRVVLIVDHFSRDGVGALRDLAVVLRAM